MFDADKINEWKACRRALLSDDMLKLFSNKFLKNIDLTAKEADKNIDVNDDLIASL